MSTPCRTPSSRVTRVTNHHHPRNPRSRQPAGSRREPSASGATQGMVTGSGAGRAGQLPSSDALALTNGMTARRRAARVRRVVSTGRVTAQGAGEKVWFERQRAKWSREGSGAKTEDVLGSELGQRRKSVVGRSETLNQAIHIFGCGVRSTTVRCSQFHQ